MRAFMKRKRVPSHFWPIRGDRSKFEDELYCIEAQHRYLVLKWFIDRAAIIPKIEARNREKDRKLHEIIEQQRAVLDSAEYLRDNAKFCADAGIALDLICVGICQFYGIPERPVLWREPAALWRLIAEPLSL
jgi:hypothetical protein